MVIARVCILALLVAVSSVAAPAGVETFPTAWEHATPGSLPQALVLDRKGRGFLHVALKNGGLAIFDVSRSGTAPSLTATIGTRQLGGLDVMHLAQQGDLLYLALGDFFNAHGSKAGLAVVDVANPRKPVVLSIWTSERTLRGAAAVAVRDRYVYLGAMNQGVLIFDAKDPRAVRKVAGILPDPDFPRKKPGKIQYPNARGLAIQDGFLYVAYDAGGLRVIDVSNPLTPREISRYVNARMGNKQQAYNNLAIDGSTVYVAVDYAGMEVLDVRDPGRIKQIAWWNPWNAETPGNIWFNSPGHTNQIAYDAKRRLVYLSGGDSDLLVVDVSDRNSPRLTAQFGKPKDKLGAWGLELAPSHVYLAYITAVIPFQGTWCGIKAVRR